MSAQTGISWTDSTFNYWMGCTKVSPACDHCYAERDMDTRLGKVKWGAGSPRVLTGIKNRNLPHRWNRIAFVQCSECGWRGEQSAVATAAGCPSCGSAFFAAARRRVFSSSLSDWLDNEVPIEWLVGLLDTIRQTPNLDWLLLTKRIGNWSSRLGKAAHHVANLPVTEDSTVLGMWLMGWLNGSPPPNVWIGATVENQAVADRDIPKLLRVPAAVRFLSVEPMLGPISLDCWPVYGPDREKLLYWVIAGGESGPHARPMHPDWVRSLRDQCSDAGVPFHFKQHGEWVPVDGPKAPGYSGAEFGGKECNQADLWIDRDGTTAPIDHGRRVLNYSAWSQYRMRRVGKKAAGRLLDGREWNEFPRSAL